MIAPNDPNADQPGMNSHNQLVAEKLLEQIGIPSKPEVLLIIQQELSKQFPDVDLIEKSVERDLGIAAKVIRLSNSAFFSGKAQIASIKQAFLRLGLQTFHKIVIASAAREALGNESPINERLWDHAELVAITCQKLAHKTCPELEESAYLLGLFHDCAIPMLSKQSKDYLKMVEQALIYNPESVKMEEEVFETDHCMAGYLITENWGISNYISKAILCHHDRRIGKEVEKESAIPLSLLILAENIIQSAEKGEDLLFSQSGPNTLMADICSVLKVDEDKVRTFREEWAKELAHHVASKTKI
jgi:HD-like signal output (HDOD) protein